VNDVSFTSCQNLRQLLLKNNRITSLSVSAFRGLSQLTELDLSDNRLSSLSKGLFRSCSVLSAVYLSHNQLTVVQVGTFAGPVSLRDVDLSWNKLTTLTADETRLTSLDRLSLSGNPLHCHCHLSWLSAYSVPVNHNTTICCPQHDVRPQLCRYIVCGVSHAACPATTLPTGLCSQTVPWSLIGK